MERPSWVNALGEVCRGIGLKAASVCILVLLA